VTIPKLFENPPPAWTIEWFMNPSDLSNAQTSYYLGAMEGIDAFAFYVSSEGSVFVGTEENNAIQTEADFIQKDTWQHIAFTFNRGVAKLYKNGTLIQSKEGMANSIPWNGFMGQYIMGQLDELRFWQCALSADIIREQMFTPLTGNETDLVAYYQMDQSVAANLLDTKDVYHGDIENPDDVSYCLSTAWATRVVNTNGNVSVQTGYDFEGQLNATILVSPSHGHIDIDNSNTRLIYHVDQDYSGTDTFSYNISDGLETDSYTITMFTNSLPQLSGIPAETKIMEGVTAFPVAFQLTDTDTDISQLSLHVETSDSGIVDLSDIDIDGTGFHRFLRITTQSCQAGPVTLTLSIDDGYARVEYSVNLIIESVYHDGPGGICSKDQGLALWFKADAISGLLDGTPLQKWDDLSHHQNHLSQSNQKHRPIYRTNQINGLPAVSFDGLDDALIAPFSSTPPVNALSLFSVNRTGTDKIKDESQIIISMGEHLRKGFRMGRLDSESTYQPVLISYHNTIDRLLKHSQSLSDSEFSTMSGIWYSDRIDFGCNEQTETEQYSDSHGPFLYGENLYLTFGADRRRDGFSTSFLKGDIAEIFAYDTGLSSAHVHILQTYMNVKYGLADSRNELGMQTHTTDVCGIGREGDGANKVFYSQGLIVRDYGFLSDDGDYLFAAHNGTPIMAPP
jgi:hypothetical protein